MKRFLTGALALTLAGCLGDAGAPGDHGGESYGAVHAELRAAPAGVACVAVRLAGPLMREVRAAVTTGTSTVIDVGQLPLVDVQVQASAYDTACPADGTEFIAAPTWISDVAHVQLRAGETTPVSIELRPYQHASVAVDFQPAFVDVALSRDAAYWLTSDGRVMVAGNAAAVGGFHAVTAIATSPTHGCAIHDSGRVSCWGANAWGQLGNGTLTDSADPVDVSLPAAANAIALGDTHSCARLVDERLVCWGRNSFHQVSPATSERVVFPTFVYLPTGVHATALHAGAAHTCAIGTDRNGYCWGGTTHSGGSPPSTAILTSPAVVFPAAAGPGGVVSIGGQLTAYAAYELGALVQWDATLPAYWVPNVPDADYVTASYYDVCLIDAHDGLWCDGALRGNVAPDITTFVRPRHVETAAFVRVGGGHACAVDLAGVAWCWGSNASGELGDGTTLVHPAPVRVTTLDPARAPITPIALTGLVFSASP